MKNLSEYLNERLNEAEETIKSEKDFREAAKAKFEEVYGDDLDEDKMKKTIDGLLDDNKDLVDKGEWGKLIGMLNKSFAPKSTNEGLLDAKAAMNTNTKVDIDALPRDRRLQRWASDLHAAFEAIGKPLVEVTWVPAPEYGSDAKVCKTKFVGDAEYEEIKRMQKSKDYASYVEKHPELCRALLGLLFPSRADELNTDGMIGLFTELFG